MKSSTTRTPRTNGKKAEELAAPLAEHFPETASFYVPHPLFETPGAEKEIFGEDGVDGELPGCSGTVLTPVQERALFTQYNYCRFRTSKKLEALQKTPNSEKLFKETMYWQCAGLDRRNQIIECNLGLVAMMIRNFRMETVDYDELASEGNLTLMYAVNKFDVSRGFRFSTYACQAIHHAMTQAAAKRGRRPWMSIEGTDVMADYDDGASRPFADEIRQVHEIIHRNEAQLSDVELKVIRSRFALPMTMIVDSRLDPMTREQVGRLIGVSKVRVRQIERNALSKLRGSFEHLNVA